MAEQATYEGEVKDIIGGQSSQAIEVKVVCELDGCLLPQVWRHKIEGEWPRDKTLVIAGKNAQYHIDTNKPDGLWHRTTVRLVTEWTTTTITEVTIA